MEVFLSVSVVCLLPDKINLVFSGFINKRLSKHQSPNLKGSSFVAETAFLQSCTPKDMYNLVSST